MPRNMPERDQYGRFVSHDDHYDDRRHSSHNNRNYYERERNDHRSGKGHGGWFGDSEGHAEAARRGWDERREDRDYDDNRNRRR